MNFYNDENFEKEENEVTPNEEICTYEEEKYETDNADTSSLFDEDDISVDFIKTKINDKKQKRYVSVTSFAICLILVCTISVFGGAFLASSGILTNGNKITTPANYKTTTVNDNINNSTSIKGQNVTIDKINGQALSTPEIVDLVGPAVVGIINKTTFGNAYGYYGFFGDVNEEIEQSSASGVIISSDGYIVTNNHVVDNATKISVILNTGEEYEAKIIGKDASTDLAVIKINASNLIYAQMGTSSSLRVGEKAIAIGNPLGQEFAGSTTQGIISGLNRSVTIDNKTMTLIQTDAAINPGNSGGALVNEYGQLIGINTAKISSSTLEGLGFAIPIDEAKPVIEQLIDNGYVKGRPIIGIAGRAVTKEDAKAYNMKVGVYVSTITANGPAHLSGIKVGDIIVECDGEPIETVDDINELKEKKLPGDEMKIKIYRKGRYINITLILGEEMPS